MQLKSTERQTVKLGTELYGEVGLYILEGSIESEGTTFEPKELLVAKDSSLCEFTMNANTTIYFFGGDPFPEERFIYWNFVTTDHRKIDEAKRKWEAQEFKPIPGETDFIPLPPENIYLKPKQ